MTSTQAFHNTPVQQTQGEAPVSWWYVSVTNQSAIWWLSSLSVAWSR